MFALNDRSEVGGSKEAAVIPILLRPNVIVRMASRSSVFI